MRNEIDDEKMVPSMLGCVDPTLNLLGDVDVCTKHSLDIVHV